MKISRKLALWGAAAVIVAVAATATVSLRARGETINYADLNKIKAEGLQRSQVMELCSWLSDVYAPRLTGSPMAQKGADWAVAKMKEWGLQNVAIEPWANKQGFERGWTNDKFYMAFATADGKFPIPGTPTAWTPGTNGLVTGGVVLVTATTEEDLAAFKGKLKGKWVLTVAPPDVPAFWEPQAKRFTTEELQKMELQTPPGLEFGVTPPGQGRAGAAAPAAPAAQAGQRGQAASAAAPAAGQPPAAAQAGQRGQAAGAAAQAAGQRGQAAGAPAPAAGQPPAAGGRGGQGPANVRNAFFLAEGALGLISTAPRGHGVYTIGGNRAADPATTLPAIAIPAEQYNRIARMLARNVAVSIEADIKNTFHPNPAVFNIVGEITGTDKAEEVVLLGGHFDTWHAATGAADDNVGVAAMMEALRILKATGVKLRRTVRVGLWEGEEQGLLGSREYVAAHLATRGPAPGAAAGAPGGGRGFGGPQGPLEKKPDYDKFNVYFNIDNGSGALRGIYLQGNDAVAPIFREWMEPFRALGMTTLTIRNTGGTDHLSFDGVELPGFQFIQDELEYSSLTHHTNLDTYERLQPTDVQRMATIAAGFAYLAANRDEKLPRKPAMPAGMGGRGRGGN